MPFYQGGGLIPSGLISMWKGSIASIPAGWVLCDGNSGTPDLRNKFIVAANADSGGIAKSTITGAALQSGGANTHFHNLKEPTGGSTSVIINSVPDGGLDRYSTTENNIPTFYALAYIMKL